MSKIERILDDKTFYFQLLTCYDLKLDHFVSTDSTMVKKEDAFLQRLGAVLLRLQFRSGTILYPFSVIQF